MPVSALMMGEAVSSWVTWPTSIVPISSPLCASLDWGGGGLDSISSLLSTGSCSHSSAEASRLNCCSSALCCSASSTGCGRFVQLESPPHSLVHVSTHRHTPILTSSEVPGPGSSFKLMSGEEVGGTSMTHWEFGSSFGLTSWHSRQVLRYRVIFPQVLGELPI